MWYLNESVTSGVCTLDRIRHLFTAHTKQGCAIYTLSE